MSTAVLLSDKKLARSSSEDIELRMKLALVQGARTAEEVRLRRESESGSPSACWHSPEPRLGIMTSLAKAVMLNYWKRKRKGPMTEIDWQKVAGRLSG